MAVYALGDRRPEIDPSAYVHPQATIIGSVVLHAGASVWPGAVVRADDNSIEIGEDSNVQDGAVLHCTAHLPTIVGRGVVIGHLAHLEGCTIEDGALVGVGSTVLHRARVCTGALVGAGAVVTNDTEVPSGAMALGVPAKIHPDRVVADEIRLTAEIYARRAVEYRDTLIRLD